MDLPLSPCSICPLTSSDYIAKGRFHRITRGTSPALVQHFVLDPLSFSTLSRYELQRYTVICYSKSETLMSVRLRTHSTCHLCVNHSYDPQLPPTSIELRSELSGLIVFDLLGYDLRDLKSSV